jgi:hypothetical protein
MPSTTGGDQQQARGRRQASGQQKPPRHHHGTIVSHSAGRVRVRLHPAHRHEAVLGEVQQDLLTRAGISTVTTNTQTGSVLVQYDRHRLTRDDLLSMLRDVGIMARDMSGGAEELPEALDPSAGGSEVVPHSTTATGLMDALTDLDRRLSDLTGGKLDVKLLFPLGLGIMATRQIATAGLGLAEVPGYVLLWYAFDSFYKLHQRRTAHVLEAAAEHVIAHHPDPNAPGGKVVDHVVEDMTIVDEPPPG